MINERIFRECDIRGLVGTDLTEETVLILARAIGTYFRQNNVERVSLGYDARQSSLIFLNIFVDAFKQSGLTVLEIGMIPTPILYFTLFVENVDAGVMITGSHNPSEYNGFKICLGKSTIYGKQIQAIKNIALAGIYGEGNGDVSKKDIVGDYLEFVAKNIKPGKRKLKVVIDAGNGVGGIIGAPLYRRLGCETINLFMEPDSRFPNHHPDPADNQNLQFAVDAVLENKADLAIAFDGDGDRIGVVDETGNIIKADELMMIFSRSILKTQPNAVFIADVKCSQKLFDDIEQKGGKAIMSKVGHSLIKAEMKESGATLAGEMSGHIFFADRFFGFDDAIYCGARLLEILSNSEKSLSEFLIDLPRGVNTAEIRIKCPEEQKFEVVRQITSEFKKTNKVIEIDGARILFENGWGLVRASNTQAVLSLRFEANDEESLKEIKSIIENKIKRFL